MSEPEHNAAPGEFADYADGDALANAAIAGEVKLGKQHQFVATAPDGRRKIINGTQVAGAYGQGYQIELPHETSSREHQEKYGDGSLNELKAAGASVARGFTFGGSDALLTGNFLGKKVYDGPVAAETLHGLEEANPGISLGGEIAGTILPQALMALGTGGASVPGQIAATGSRFGLRGALATAGHYAPTALLSHLTEGIAERAGGAILGRLGEGKLAAMAAQGLGAGVGSAVEGAAYGAGHIVSEKALGNPEDVSSMLAAHVGMGALFGGIAGGALGAASAAFSRGHAAQELIESAPHTRAPSIHDTELGEVGARLAPGEVAPAAEVGQRAVANDLDPLVAGGPTHGAPNPATAADNLGAATKEFSGADHPIPSDSNFVTKAISSLSGVAEHDLKPLLALNKSGEEMRILAGSGQGARDSLNKTLTDNLNTLAEHGQSLKDLVTGQSKVKNLKGMLEGVDPGNIYDMAHADLDRALSHISGLRDIPGEFNEVYLAKGEKLFNTAKKRLNDVIKEGGSELDQASKLRTIMDETKQRFGDGVYRPLKGAPTVENRVTHNEMAKIYDGVLKPHLEDAKIYGERVAQAHAKVNLSWNDLLSDAKFTEQRIYAHTGYSRDGLKKVYSANPQAIEAHLNGMGTQAHSLQDNMLASYVSKTDNLIDSIAEHYDLSPTMQAHLAAAKKSVTDIKEGMATAGKTVKAQNVMKSLEAAQKNSVGLSATMAGLGLAAAGPAGAVVGGALGAFTKPANLIKGLAMLERTASGTGIHITQSLDHFLGGVVTHGHPLAHIKEAVSHVTREQLREFGTRMAEVAEEHRGAAAAHGEAAHKMSEAADKMGGAAEKISATSEAMGHHVKEASMMAADRISAAAERSGNVMSSAAERMAAAADRFHPAPKAGDATQKVRPAARAHEEPGKRLPQSLRSTGTAIGEGLYHGLGPAHRDEHGEKQPRSRAELFQAQSRRITQAVANPTAVLQRVADRLHGVTQVAPQVSQQMQNLAGTALNYVYQKMPKDPDPPSVPGLKSPYMPSAAEIHSFDKTSRAVQDPLSVLDDLREGKLSQEGVDALKAVYPPLYTQIVKASMDRLADMHAPVPYGKRIQLAVLLGQPLDPTLQPGYLQMVQGSGGQPQQGSQAPAAGPAQKSGKMRMTGLESLKLGERSQSAAERIQESA